ncbi:MAG TPA: gamma-glutamyl-gamma-aminobutyrate hydrolase family protein [Planctomycetaceae bacterium]|nr:gamma-glutamyl-gamma-aminobutyrate hydrolase family protein [Planctomycetaceae bacterium]
MKLIATTQRVTMDPTTGERRDALDQCWTTFLVACGFTPLVIPNHVETACLLMQQEHVCGLLLTGGNDLAGYGGDAPERDATELALLEMAMRTRQPVLGVCRGMQFLQHHAGATLQRVTGHVAVHHTLTFGGETIRVNSFHNWGATSTVAGLDIAAVADDGVIEAVVQHERRQLGIMWHPERATPFQPRDIALVQNHFSGNLQ